MFRFFQFLLPRLYVFRFSFKKKSIFRGHLGFTKLTYVLFSFLPCKNFFSCYIVNTNFGFGSLVNRHHPLQIPDYPWIFILDLLLFTNGCLLVAMCVFGCVLQGHISFPSEVVWRQRWWKIITSSVNRCHKSTRRINFKHYRYNRIITTATS